ncbi:MAG: hypothetical protein PVH89_08640 [Gammaproteobacteria bacterium]
MTSGRPALIAVVVVVVGAVIAGLVISGSPREQRLLRTDDERVNDLRRVSRAIERYYRETESLPADLQTLLNGWISQEIPRDPDTGQAYGYELLDETAYRLCADFALESRPTRQPEFWEHATGRQCFSFDYAELVLD